MLTIIKNCCIIGGHNALENVKKNNIYIFCVWIGSRIVFDKEFGFFLVLLCNRGEIGLTYILKGLRVNFVSHHMQKTEDSPFDKYPKLNCV